MRVRSGWFYGWFFSNGLTFLLSESRKRKVESRKQKAESRKVGPLEVSSIYGIKGLTFLLSESRKRKVESRK